MLCLHSICRSSHYILGTQPVVPTYILLLASRFLREGPSFTFFHPLIRAACGHPVKSQLQDDKSVLKYKARSESCHTERCA